MVFVMLPFSVFAADSTPGITNPQNKIVADSNLSKSAIIRTIRKRARGQYHGYYYRKKVKKRYKKRSSYKHVSKILKVPKKGAAYVYLKQSL